MSDIWVSERDVFEFLDMVDEESLDGVITDLPYPTTERHRARGTTTRTKNSASSSNPWYSVLSISQLSRVISVLYEKLKPDTYAFFYVDDSTYLLLAQARGVIGDLSKLTQPGVANSRAPKDQSGFGWWNPLTWVKTTLDAAPLHDWCLANGQGGPDGPPAKWNEHRVVKLRGGTGYHPPGGAVTERILMMEKGKSALRHSFFNAFLEPRPRAKPKGATAKAASPKPAKIAEVLTRAMAEAGGLICDPFVGCGTHAAGIVAAGCDALINDADLSIARDWLPNVYGLDLNEWA